MSAAITFNHCLPGEGMIESEVDCIAAASSISAQYTSSAGSEWASGCLWHNGGVYYSPHEDNSTQNPTDGYICTHAHVLSQNTCYHLQAHDLPVAMHELESGGGSECYGANPVRLVLGPYTATQSLLLHFAAI